MKLTNSLVIIMCSLFYSSSSHAGFYTAGDVYSYCTESESGTVVRSYLNQAECRGYVSGVYDLSTATTLKDKVCLNDGITIKQVAKIFIAYIDKNPQKMNLSAGSVIENAIYEAFRCQK